jgi:hypothetical protein
VFESTIIAQHVARRSARNVAAIGGDAIAFGGDSEYFCWIGHTCSFRQAA